MVQTSDITYNEDEIYFSVRSPFNINSGRKWKSFFQKRDQKPVRIDIERILDASGFQSPPELEIFNVVVLKGVKARAHSDFMRGVAKNRGRKTPPTDLGCILNKECSNDLIRNTLGLKGIVVMHNRVYVNGVESHYLLASKVARKNVVYPRLTLQHFDFGGVNTSEWGYAFLR